MLVYPRGMAIGEARSLLESADIECRPAAVPFTATVSPGRRNIYMIDHERLRDLGDQAAIEKALTVIAATGGTVVIVSDPGDYDASWLAHNPNVGGWLTRPIDPVALLGTVRSAERTLALVEETREALRQTEDQKRESEQLLKIGVALSAERDITALQRLIVRQARELTQADGGSLFLIVEDEEEKKLRFAVAQSGPTDEGTLLGALLPLTRGSLAGNVAMTGEVLRIPDVYEIGETREYRFNPAFDKKNNYRTKSMLCVPMRNYLGEVVGVIQLINKKPSFSLVLESPEHTGEVVSEFAQHDEQVLLSLASQAGVALDNKQLVDSIQDLFEQFVKASVKAIEARDRATQGHSSRVADLTVAQAEMLNTVEAGPLTSLKFTPDGLREMRYAALLHDFGKVAVPEYIFGKAKKLPDGRLDLIKLRCLLGIEQIQKKAGLRKLSLLKAGADPESEEIVKIDTATESAVAELADLLKAVEGANEPRVVAEGVGDALEALLRRNYIVLGEEKPLLEPAEYEYLKIPRGSLSADERQKMEQHVTQSFRFLREIPWSKTPWSSVAEIAYGHHEHLDGTGYPRGLRGDEIVPQVRLLTISDVFDALTASDRPYKPAMPIERALDILTKEFAERGKVDAQLLDLFITKKVYEPIMAAKAAAAAASAN
ncbi:MAG: GAF domain-containing protein [Candidatus Eremiobacteraeota bacterium]|nr:GAF domain-containing protein [Candidatus Eremiobacteraeota bacterium]MBV8355821.1 GAF domain-containing protein [Candidatus Eremiobacteraeota bacterium]